MITFAKDEDGPPGSLVVPWLVPVVLITWTYAWGNRLRAANPSVAADAETGPGTGDAKQQS